MNKLIVTIALLIILILAIGIPIRYWIDNYPIEVTKIQYIDRVIEKEVVKVEYISDINWQEFEVTAYTSFDDGCNNYSAIGLNIAKWDNYFTFVAVDPDVIEYGTTVFIKTDDEIIEALAVDTGGAIQGKHIDLYINDLDLAYEWGVKTLPVGVVE